MPTISLDGVLYIPLPTFCQDGAQDFFNIKERIGGGGVVENFQRSRGQSQNLSSMSPTFIALTTPTRSTADAGQHVNNLSYTTTST